MDKVDKVKQHLYNHKINYVLDCKVRPTDGKVLLYVLSKNIGPSSKKHLTSERKLTNLRRRILSETSIEVEVLRIEDKEQKNIEDSVVTLVNKKHKNAISSLYISFVSDGHVNVYVDLLSQQTDDIEKSIISAFDLSSIEVKNIFWSKSSKQPANILNTLRYLKINQPINAEDLCTKINKEEHIYSDLKSLKNMLDLLRKKNLLIRHKSGMYTLTTKGVVATPAGATHTSSDIARALALSKRKWSNQS